MSQNDIDADTGTKNEHLDETDTPNEKNEIGDDQHQHKRKKSGRAKKQDTWKGVFVVTQFWVITLAVVAFLVAIYATAAKLSDRQILETKDTETVRSTWFKFAICLRPFMTADLMKEIFAARLNKSFVKHVTSLDILSQEEKAEFKRPFYFDNTLQSHVYKHYFRRVHPWEDMSPRVFWEYQNITIRRAFEEFQVNSIRISSDTGNQLNIGNTDTYDKFTILTAPNAQNLSTDGPVLVGEYLLSPLYLGCLSMTVNQEMSRKQMEISVKFRNRRTAQGSKSDSENRTTEGQYVVTLFEAADVFVFNRNDTFIEIPTIKDHAKFSLMADSRERLLVKSSMYIRQRSRRRNCETDEAYSEIKCRENCIFGGLLKEINCTLPWMERLNYKPKLKVRIASIPMCSSLNATSFLETVETQEAFLNPVTITGKASIQDCLGRCLEPCSSSQVRILSLGSKSIGSNYGVSLTISPAIDVVREHFNYNFNNMVSELCAAVSFLLGLSAIAIYDWLVAFGVWASIKLGLYTAEEVDGAPATSPQPHAPYSRHGQRRQTDAPAGKVVGARADSRPNASAVWHMQPAEDDVGGQEGGRQRRVSLQLPQELLGPPPNPAV